MAYETNLLGYLLAVFGILIFGVLSLLMMPFLVGLTRQAVHKCARCLNDVKQASLFGFDSLEDKVIARKFGNFGFILTRRTLLYIISIIAVFLSIYTFIVVEEKTHGIRKYKLVKLLIFVFGCEDNISSITWEDYRGRVGYDSYKKNSRAAFRTFEMNYFGRQVSWDGYVVRVNLNDEDPLSLSYHSANIMVKMNVSDVTGGTGADLGVTFSELSLERNGDVIEELHMGDHIRFNATILSLGDTHHLHHLRSFDIKKLDGHMDVQAHTHNTGRYKLKLAHNETESIGKHY